MKLIASFQVDHTKIRPGIYVSRRDAVRGGYITTFDVRMKSPNIEPAIHPDAMHTIEHIVATFLRNSPFQDNVIYWGPMGCLTGCYFLTNTVHKIQPREIAPLVREAFQYLANYEGEVPGASAVNCGYCLMHNLPMAKYEAAQFLARKWRFHYQHAKRATTDNGIFYDA